MYLQIGFLLKILSLCSCSNIHRNEGWHFLDLHCRDNDNKPVDWWYILKPPGSAAPYEDFGRNFSFITSEYQGRWFKSDRLISSTNMLHRTLSPMFRPTYTDYLAYIIYEATPPSENDSGSTTRAVLMADEMGGTYIGHTVPGLVNIYSERYKFPESEVGNGHLLVCLSLDLGTINELAMLLRNSGPQVVDVRVPDHLRSQLPGWIYLQEPLDTVWLPSRSLEFLTESGTVHGLFMLRSPREETCLYQNFARKMKIVLDVYGPTPGHKPKKNFCSETFSIRNLDSISLKTREWIEYVDNDTDMSRFAVSTAAHWQRQGAAGEHYWTCNGGLANDETKNGGVLLCIENYQIWLSFDNLKVKEPLC